MRRAIPFSIVTATIPVLMLLSIQAQTVDNFTMTNFGGTGGPPLGLEVDGMRAVLGICAGDSSLVAHQQIVHSSYPIPGSGKFTCTTTGWMEMAEWQPSAANCPGGLEAEIEPIEQNHIIRFADGAMMWWLADKDAYNFMCFYPEEGFFEQIISWHIVGGSGRFEGVTGQATMRAPMHGVPLGEESMMVAAHDGVIKGTLVYPE
jgi:hypothetical protein